MIRGIIFPTQDGVGSFSHSAGDPGQMRVQRPGVGEGQHEARSCGASGADGTEDAAPLVSHVAPGPGPCAASGSDAGESAVLADPRVRRENRPPDGFLARLTATSGGPSRNASPLSRGPSRNASPQRLAVHSATPHRNVWRSIPQRLAAVSRSIPSSTNAIASIRSTARASFVLLEAPRNCAADHSFRAIAIPAIPAASPHNRIE